MSVAGKHVVITGGGSGVGATLARVFCQAGAVVTIIGRRMPALQAVAKDTGAYPQVADVTDSEAMAQAVDNARAAHGPVQVAIANAGQAPSAPFHRLSAADVSAVLAVNLEGVFNLWRVTQDDMKAEGWGRMIAIASTAGLKGYPYVSHYCAAKHGVIGLTRALAQELGPTRITVNAICPGFIDTPLLQKSIAAIVEKTSMSPEQATVSLLTANPQQRFVETSEVAETALWLCSSAANAINGHALSLSGGEI